MIAAVVLLGAFLQAVVGLGVGLLSAPVIALVDPSLVPVLPLWVALMVSGAMLLGERRHVDWRSLAWALPARVPGTVLGAWLVVHFSEGQISVAVGVMVLLAVAVTLHTVEVELTPISLSVAGLTAGAAGTATSIGGPPIALLYQRQAPEVVRSTLSVFFFVGVILSLLGLWAGGSLTAASWHLAVVLSPAVAVGLWAGSRLRDRVPRHHFRLAMLAVCGASAVALLARALAS